MYVNKETALLITKALVHYLGLTNDENHEQIIDRHDLQDVLARLEDRIINGDRSEDVADDDIDEQLEDDYQDEGDCDCSDCRAARDENYDDDECCEEDECDDDQSDSDELEHDDTITSSKLYDLPRLYGTLTQYVDLGECWDASDRVRITFNSTNDGKVAVHFDDQFVDCVQYVKRLGKRLHVCTDELEWIVFRAMNFTPDWTHTLHLGTLYKVEE